MCYTFVCFLNFFQQIAIFLEILYITNYFLLQLILPFMLLLNCLTRQNQYDTKTSLHINIIIKNDRASSQSDMHPQNK